METEKSCSSCKHAKTAYPNAACYDCLNTVGDYKKWEPKEELVKEYVEKCLPGDNEATVTISKPAYNNVSKPKHYMLFEEQGIEVRDVIEKLVEKVYKSYETPKSMPMALADYVQMMQYLMRFMDKNGKEDLEKARWYLDKLIESY